MLPVSDFVSSDESTPESGRIDPPPPVTDDVVDDALCAPAVAVVGPLPLWLLVLLLLLLIKLLFEDITGRPLLLIFDPLPLLS